MKIRAGRQVPKPAPKPLRGGESRQGNNSKHLFKMLLRKVYEVYCDRYSGPDFEMAGLKGPSFNLSLAGVRDQVVAINKKRKIDKAAVARLGEVIDGLVVEAQKITRDWRDIKGRVGELQTIYESLRQAVK